MSIIKTARLTLRPLSVPVIDAWLTHDRPAFQRLTGGAIPAGEPVPPLMEDALPPIRDWLHEHEGERPWSWVGVDRDLETAVVAGGLGFGPDERGVVVLGYSVYPRHEGQGYATEFARALVDWAFTQPDVTAVEATIPEGHDASIRVATKAGMQPAGTVEEPEFGHVLLFRIDRP
ncbi:MAG: GNAT family N-acetyltransferase [Dehalococcoidia bacterium]